MRAARLAALLFFLVGLGASAQGQTGAKQTETDGGGQSESSPAAIFQQADLLGNWAFDCSQPAGQGNIRTTRTISPQGEVVWTQVGADAAPVQSYVVRRAALRPDGRLWASIERVETKVLYETVYELQPRADGRLQGYRIWESKVANGNYVVRDGQGVKGMPTPRPAQRCD